MHAVIALKQDSSKCILQLPRKIVCKQDHGCPRCHGKTKTHCIIEMLTSGQRGLLAEAAVGSGPSRAMHWAFATPEMNMMDKHGCCKNPKLQI